MNKKWIRQQQQQQQQQPWQWVEVVPQQNLLQLQELHQLLIFSRQVTTCPLQSSMTAVLHLMLLGVLARQQLHQLYWHPQQQQQQQLKILHKLSGSPFCRGL
jgi:hypothetical protein